MEGLYRGYRIRYLGKDKCFKKITIIYFVVSEHAPHGLTPFNSVLKLCLTKNFIRFFLFIFSNWWLIFLTIHSCAFPELRKRKACWTLVQKNMEGDYKICVLLVCIHFSLFLFFKFSWPFFLFTTSFATLDPSRTETLLYGENDEAVAGGVRMFHPYRRTGESRPQREERPRQMNMRDLRDDKNGLPFYQEFLETSFF